MSEFQPSRQQADLADVLELLLEKGIVINADIAVSIGDTQLLGVQVRAAIASFETAAKYGLAFPEGTDMDRLAAAVDEPDLAEGDRPNIPVDATRGVNMTPGGHAEPADEGDEEGSVDKTDHEDSVDERDRPHDEESASLDEFEEVSVTEGDEGESADAETTSEEDE